MREIYLDNSATTQPYPCVIDKMTDMMKNCYGNPSSLHHSGFVAEKEVNAARDAIARTLKCDKKEIVFTASGTEADNLAVLGGVMAQKRLGNHIITTAMEHPAVLRCFEKLEKDGFEVTYIPVTKTGELDLEYAVSQIKSTTILASVMAVNNELGTIFPVGEIKKAMLRVNSRGYLHCDCVQAYGKISFTPKSLGADMITISGHKIHGPKGVGALYIKKGVRVLPIILGGGQEEGLRSGTENTFAIGGFGAAVQKTFQDLPARMLHTKKLKDYTKARIEQELTNVTVNTIEASAPHILNVSLLGLKSEVMLHYLESMGIYVSAGSACSAKSGKESHVLLNGGLNAAQIESAIRISFGDFNTIEDCDGLLDGLKRCRAELKEKR